MADNRLRKIPGGWECLECGEQIPTGITHMMNHWSMCAGKEHMKEISEANEKGELTIEKLLEINKKYK